MSVELLPSAQHQHVQPSSPYQNDLKLAEHIRAGEETAKDEFASRFSFLFRQYAHRSGLPPEDAEDVAQQSLLYAYDRLRRGLFRGESSLETWGHLIIRGQIIEQWRKQRRREGGEIQLAEFAENGAEEIDTAGHAAWDTFEEWLDVIKALRELTERERTILLLNRTERRSVRELSLLLQLREAEVRKILYAAQERLRCQLGKSGFPLKRPPTTPHKALLSAVYVPHQSGDGDGRPVQAHSSHSSRRLALSRWSWLQRTRPACFTDGLLFRSC